jgi:hypothetical protein
MHREWCPFRRKHLKEVKLLTLGERGMVKAAAAISYLPIATFTDSEDGKRKQWQHLRILSSLAG